jgi:peptide deformylase
MTEYKIVTRGHEALHQVAEEVPHWEDVSELIHGMYQVMYDGGGIGLAANQVGVLKRIIVMDVKGFRIVIINPVITRQYGGSLYADEGCLSFPGEMARVLRWGRIKVEGYNEQWEPVSYNLKKLNARCVQHEVDHLNGRSIEPTVIINDDDEPQRG